MPKSLQYPVLAGNLIVRLEHPPTSLTYLATPIIYVSDHDHRGIYARVVAICSFLWALAEAPIVMTKVHPIGAVCVVLSASSVPRVGRKAAVRRLHRADLVREMAGMLGSWDNWPVWPRKRYLKIVHV